MAILSDALHDFGDSIALGLSWYLEKQSNKAGDGRFSYGYRRFSLLAALVSTIVLIVGSLFILSESVPRIFRPEHSNAQGMVVFALVGILVNGAAALRLKQGKSLNMRVAAWHLLEDVLGWAAVLAVSIILLFRDIHILDPLLSILITLYVLSNVIINLRKTLALFLQAVPDDLDVAEVERIILDMPVVNSVHHTHAWSLDGEHHVLTMHVVVDEDATKEDLISVRRQFREIAEKVDLAHTTLEIEYQDEDCIMR
jgi:cobalt-zinc-cadmium efflux system protein